MKHIYILPLDDVDATLERVGGKGASLAQMARTDLPVPGGFHVTTDAYMRFVSENEMQGLILDALGSADEFQPDTLEQASQKITQLFLDAPVPPDLADSIKLAYTRLPGSIPAVAVRSSATSEDLPGASFAGQQETFLNVRGADALMEATRKCWASLWTARAIGYRLKQGIDQEKVALAVVVQTLVDAEAAGILFTANPMKGSQDQMVINASWGLGESVVGGMVTPDTLVCESASGKVIHAEIAEKLVQTIRTDAGTMNGPVPEARQRKPVLDEQQAAELVRLGNQIEALFGTSMDIEWALSEGRYAILQARPITALHAPEVVIPTEWKLPEGAYIAMQNNIVELMADPLTPLFKTMGLEAVNTSMNNLLTSFFGKPGIMPDELIITVNEYAYYNGSIKPVNMVRLFLNAGGILRRMFTGAVERWTEIERPRYQGTIENWHSKNWQEMTSAELVRAARELTESAIDAYGALVGGVIPAAWISEAIFTFINKLVKKRDDPDAPTYLMGFDNIPLKSEKTLYDLASWVQTQPALRKILSGHPTRTLVEYMRSEGQPEDIDSEVWQNWRNLFQKYLQDYGHMIYNLDFGRPVPADDPSPMLGIIQLFLSGQGSSPYDRQRELVERREAATQQMKQRLKGLRLKVFQRNLDRAQKYAPLREDALAEVGMSYPLVRKMLQEVGQRLVDGSMIEDPEDIYWLHREEVEDAADRIDRGEVLENCSAVIHQRKAVWQAALKVTSPVALPQIKIFGRDLMALKSEGLKRKKDDTLKGVGASAGKVTATACVIHGPEDFSKMSIGGVLVAPLTTPAWTPLFARAAAIVTDVGGPLSHGSIVAREYGIPAVLGTGGATKRVHHGQIITVDGDSGIVTLN